MNKNKNHNWNLETTQTWIAKEKNLHYNGKFKKNLEQLKERILLQQLRTRKEN